MFLVANFLVRFHVQIYHGTPYSNGKWFLVCRVWKHDVALTSLAGAPALTFGNKGTEALMSVTFCCLRTCACLLIVVVIGPRFQALHASLRLYVLLIVCFHTVH